MLRSTSQPLHRSPEQYDEGIPTPHTATSDGSSSSSADPASSPRQPVAAPALRPAHYDCYIQHRPLLPSRNLRAPVRCMTCGGDAPCMFKCGWCCLRICGACARILAACRGDLAAMAPPAAAALAGDDALRRRVEREVEAAAREIRAGSGTGRAPESRDAGGGETRIAFGDPRPKRSGVVAPLAAAAAGAPNTPWPGVYHAPPEPPNAHAPQAPLPRRPAPPTRTETAPPRPPPPPPPTTAARDPTPPRHIRFREPERPPHLDAAAQHGNHLAVARHIQPPVSAEDSCFDIAGSRVAHAKARFRHKMPLF